MLEKLNIQPECSTESHSEYAYRVIRNNILEFTLLPGTLLNEAEIADALKISRTPVHEAVNRLKDDKFVDVVPRKESKVSLINISLVNEGIFMRCAIETQIIKLVAGNIPLDYVKKFQDNLDSQKKILDNKKEIQKFYPLDDEFHKLIYESANKSNIYSSVQKVVGHFDRLRHMIPFDGGYDIETYSYKEHKELFSILMFGLTNEIDVDQFSQRHIMRFQNNMPILVEKYSDYFSFA